VRISILSKPEAGVMSIVATILAHIIKYLTGIWTCARMIFDVLPVQTMQDCVGLLCVIFLIQIIDNAPNMLKRKKKKEDDDEEMEELKTWMKKR